MEYDFGNGTKVVQNGMSIEVYKNSLLVLTVNCANEQELENTFDEEVERLLEGGY